MLANYVGEEAFLKGVSIYLKKRLYGNSVTRDLWDGISEATGLNIADMMENWTLKVNRLCSFTSHQPAESTNFARSDSLSSRSRKMGTRSMFVKIVTWLLVTSKRQITRPSGEREPFTASTQSND